MKIYARQIPPEYQESPLYIMDEFFPDNIAVCGNRDYKEHTPDIFDTVWNVLYQGELASMIEDKREWAQWYKNITAAITDYLPPSKGKYSTREIGALTKLISSFSYCHTSDEKYILCDVLSIVTGEEWAYRMIRGCCQSDWNNVYYPVKNWSNEALEHFESEYFNTGSEWIIDDEGFNPESDSPSDISGYSVYCTSWNDDGIRKEIADIAEVSPEDVILYVFEGYAKTAQYREVI